MRRRLYRVAVMALVALAMSALLPGCGLGDSGGTTDKPATAPTAPDSSRTAYGKAIAAVKAEAADAVLASVGTQGVALSDNPSVWSFYFVSPSTRKVWQVVVDHGDVLDPKALGEAKAEVDYASAVQFDSIKTAAAEAIEKARAFGQESGTVPADVIVSGTFLDVAGAEDLGATLGSWTVTFANGTDLTGSRVFTVKMSNGAVAEVKQ